MDTLVKERLTGAVILVGLIVVLVPELLSGPIRRPVDTHGTVLPSEKPTLRSIIINLDETRPDGGAARPQPSAPAVPAAVEPAAAPAASGSSQPASPPSTAAATQPPPAATLPVTSPTHAVVAPRAPPSAVQPSGGTPPAATPAASSGAGFVVQLGSFANRANAERLAQQVHALGYPVGVSRGTTGRRLYRVRVGPTRERAAAEQLAAKLLAQGHKGAVVPK